MIVEALRQTKRSLIVSGSGACVDRILQATSELDSLGIISVEKVTKHTSEVVETYKPKMEGLAKLQVTLHRPTIVVSVKLVVAQQRGERHSGKPRSRHKNNDTLRASNTTTAQPPSDSQQLRVPKKPGKPQRTKRNQTEYDETCVSQTLVKPKQQPSHANKVKQHNIEETHSPKPPSNSKLRGQTKYKSLKPVTATDSKEVLKPLNGPTTNDNGGRDKTSSNVSKSHKPKKSRNRPPNPTPVAINS
eukprot:CFRG8342T1